MTLFRPYKGKQLDVVIQRDTLSVGVRGEKPVLAGKLPHTVQVTPESHSVYQARPIKFLVV